MKSTTAEFETTGSPKTTTATQGPPTLPVADWHRIHDAALDMHRSENLEAALEQFAKFIHRYQLGDHVRACLTQADGTIKLLIPGEKVDSGESTTKEGYQATFDIDLAEKGRLRVSLALPIAKSVRDQVKLEILLEHFSIAAQHLPVHRS